MRLIVRYAIAGLVLSTMLQGAEAAKKRTGKSLAAARQCGESYEIMEQHCKDTYANDIEMRDYCQSKNLLEYNNCLDRADKLPGGRAVRVTKPGQTAPNVGDAPAEREPVKRTPAVTSGNQAPLEQGASTPAPVTIYGIGTEASYYQQQTPAPAQPTKQTTTRKKSSTAKKRQ